MEKSGITERGSTVALTSGDRRIRSVGYINFNYVPFKIVTCSFYFYRVGGSGSNGFVIANGVM